MKWDIVSFTDSGEQPCLRPDQMSITPQKVLGLVDPNTTKSSKPKGIPLGKEEGLLSTPHKGSEILPESVEFTALETPYRSIEEIYEDEIKEIVDPVKEAFSISPL